MDVEQARVWFQTLHLNLSQLQDMLALPPYSDPVRAHEIGVVMEIIERLTNELPRKI